MENTFSWDKFSAFIGNTLDKVSQGVQSYYSSRVAYNQAEADLALSDAQRRAAQQYAELDTGSPASAWGDPNAPSFSLGGNTQSLLVLAAVGLVVVAIAKG